MSIDDKLDRLDAAVGMVTDEINRLREENRRLKRDISKIADKIEKEGDYYYAEINSDIAKGLYMALEFLKTI